MLTEKMRKCAEYYALTGIAKEDVEYLCKCKWEELPKEFFEYVKEVERNYNKWIDDQRAMAAELTVNQLRCSNHGFDVIEFYVDTEEDPLAIIKGTPIIDKKITPEGDPSENYLYFKLYPYGLVSYGYYVHNDKMHGGPYVWSSNSECINNHFKLKGTDFELVKFDVAIKQFSDDGCYCSLGITRNAMYKIINQAIHKGVLNHEWFDRSYYSPLSWTPDWKDANSLMTNH